MPDKISRQNAAQQNQNKFDGSVVDKLSELTEHPTKDRYNCSEQLVMVKQSRRRVRGCRRFENWLEYYVVTFIVWIEAECEFDACRSWISDYSFLQEYNLSKKKKAFATTLQKLRKISCHICRAILVSVDIAEQTSNLIGKRQWSRRTFE